MISDREQKALHEMERQIMADDPRFATSFQARTQGAETGGPRKTWVTLATVVAVVLGFLMLATESVGSFFALALGVGVLWWIGHSFTDTEKPPGTG